MASSQGWVTERHELGRRHIGESAPAQTGGVLAAPRSRPPLFRSDLKNLGQQTRVVKPAAGLVIADKLVRANLSIGEVFPRLGRTVKTAVGGDNEPFPPVVV